MKIQFSDLGAQHRQIQKEIKQAINKVIRRGDFILGCEVELFEKEFAQFCGSRYAAGVSSGTAALFLALASLGIKEGDEVILPAFTYIATALAVSYTGAKPVFVDIEEKGYNINPVSVRNAINKNTKAIIPVYLYGQPANMAEIMQIARDNQLKVIEDAAQAHGAEIELSSGRWQKAGSIGDIGCFSFYPSKNLGALGDGGMVTTDNETVYKKLLMLRDYGRVSKYEHTLVGYNSRLDTLQAAVLRVKLKRLNRWNKMRVAAAEIYSQLLKDLEGVVRPYVYPWAHHVYHVYAVRLKNRQRVCEYLKKMGISVIIHYPIPLHLQAAYRTLGYKNGDFPVAEQISQEVLSLPMFPHLKENQIKFVVKAIKDALR